MEFAAKLGRPLAKAAQAKADAETRVLRLLAEGLDNDGIAAALSLSVNTVKTHIRHIFEKLNVSDRTQAALWAVRHGMRVPAISETRLRSASSPAFTISEQASCGSICFVPY